MGNFYLPNKPLYDAKLAIKKYYDCNTPRGHLGCSEIGRECMADLWHSFRWNVRAEFDANTHLRFQDGHRSEDVMAEYLKMSGVNLTTTDSDGGQFRVSVHGGHFAGSMDGIIRGGMPWHKRRGEMTIWEHKATGDAKFSKLEKLVEELGDDAHKYALKQWDEVYYAQAQMYMHLTGAKTHWLTCSTAGVRNFTGVITIYDQAFAESLMHKAELIISSDTPPSNAFTDPSFFKAKFLKAKELIYHGKVPEPNARNSLFSSPVIDDSTNAVWWDHYNNEPIPLECQATPPKHHLWIPDLIPYARCVSMENSLTPRYTVYELEDGTQFYNCQFGMEGKNAFNSNEMRFLTPELIKDPNIDTLRTGFALDARFTG